MSVFTNPAGRSIENAAAYTEAVLNLLGSRDPLEVLRETEGVLRSAVGGLSKEQRGRREASGKWSINHVLRHLADSDLVWGYRVRMILAHDRPTITGYDQDLWADRLGYEEADAFESLEEFKVLRNGNLRLLARATPEDLQRVGVHAEDLEL